MTGGKGREGVETDFSWLICTGGLSDSSSEVDESGGSSDRGGDEGRDSWVASEAAGSE
jgi:hypothetical protein